MTFQHGVDFKLDDQRHAQTLGYIALSDMECYSIGL